MALAIRILAAAACLGLAVPAEAASLSVTPVSLVRVAPAAAGTLTLTNNGARPINVQIRVFAWKQANGAETLTPAKDVVASPPITPLAPGTHYTIRIVRIAKAPVAAEESYRVFVDELPQAPGSGGASVSLVLRYSIPVFFSTPNNAPAQVAWDVRYRGGTFMLAARNSGMTRSQVASLALKDAAGQTFQLNPGLVGYVLGGSAMKWSVAPALARQPKAGPAVLTYRADGNVTEVPITLRVGG